METGEAQLVKYLPYKHKVLSSIPRTHGGGAGETRWWESPALGKSGQLEAHWPTSLAQGVAMRQYCPVLKATL